MSTDTASNMGDKRDIISGLPDCLIHLIMSALPAREAVRTCVLSKRWKNLWTTLPFLNFDLSEFENDHFVSNHNISEGSKPLSIKFEKFCHFVNMTLLLREPSDLLKFRLSCWGLPAYLDKKFTESWICYSLKHNPRVLDISINGNNSLPCNVFRCASLVDLSVCAFKYTTCIQVINLPLLRRLRLQNLYVYQDFVDKLFCSCPMLEFLHLHSCGMRFSRLCSRSLKHLKVEGPHCIGGVINRKMELIDAPNLLSIDYCGCFSTIGHTMNLPALTSARICLHHCCQYDSKSKIFSNMPNVESLELDGVLIKDILKNELPICRKSRNVTDLSINGISLSPHLNLLASCLDHFPNLKKLSLNDAGH